LLRQLPRGVHRVRGPEHEAADRVPRLLRLARRAKSHPRAHPWIPE
jgi:hypothetical protein